VQSKANFARGQSYFLYIEDALKMDDFGTSKILSNSK